MTTPRRNSAAGRLAAGARYNHSDSSLTSRPVRAHQASIVEAHHNGRSSASARSGRGNPDGVAAYNARARPSEIPARRASCANVYGCESTG
ncbi:MAG: hypothetical protein L0I24_01275 [Pseudonocardia sp.]|nr:hypothetical protein [Pseudonocardia sp.]